MTAPGVGTPLELAFGTDSDITRTPYVVAGGSPRADIGVAIAERLHGVQYGASGPSMPTNGSLTVTFTEEYEEPPVVLVQTYRPGTSLNLTSHVFSRSSTGFEVRTFHNGTRNDSDYTVTIHWIAIGRLKAKPTTERVDDDMVAGDTISTTWAGNVSDEYNLIQIGGDNTTSTPNGSGDMTITYPRAYSVAPTTVVCTNYRAGTGYMLNATLISVGTTTFAVTQYETAVSNWSNVNTTRALGLQWIALGGTLA